MDSSNWSAERKAEAGRAYARRMAKLRADPLYRARRRLSAVAAHLSVIVAKSGLARARVAERANMKPAQLSRQLGGDTNLTLESIGKICEAVGWDFDVVFRMAGKPEARQAWEVPVFNRATVFHLASIRHVADTHASGFSRETHDFKPLLEQAAANGDTPGRYPGIAEAA